MKKLLIIVLLIVSNLFGDTVTYQQGDKKRKIENVKFTRAGNGKVYFTAFGQETSRYCNRIIKFTDDDGNLIVYDCDIVFNEPKNNMPLLNTFDNSKYHNHLIESGERLIEFRKKYYNGFFISLLGQIVLMNGLSNLNQNTMLADGGISFIGGLIMLSSFNKVGQAGGKLIEAGEKLEMGK